MKRWLGIVMAAIALSGGQACGDDEGGFILNDNPSIQVRRDGVAISSGEAQKVNVAGLAENQQTIVGTFEIANDGVGALSVSEISIVSDPPNAFTVQSLGAALPTADAPVEVVDQTAPDGTRTYLFSVVYTRPASPSATGTLTIRSNSKPANRDPNPVVSFPIQTEGLQPQISVSPPVVDFTNVGANQEKTLSFNIANVGGLPLTINSFTFAGSESFTLIDGAGQWSPSAETSQGVQLAEPITIAEGKTRKMNVKFAPEGPEAATADLRFFSNDPTATSGTPVQLRGNVGGPCIQIDPQRVDFGGKLFGGAYTIDVQVTSCGDADLQVTGVRLKDGEGASEDFTLDLTSFGASNSGELTEEDAPVVIPKNSSKTFSVTYVPDEINPTDVNGKPIADLNFIEIHSNTYLPVIDVEVRGFGVEVDCPTAIIQVQEGEEVIPQTKLHLVGSQSTAPSGSIKTYEWSVQQPPGSKSVFHPSKSFADPTFEVNVAGTYVFYLNVWDEKGEAACEVAEYTVIVNPDEAIHIELLWDTPNDPDQTDEGPEAGADMDLHFTHPFATGADVDGDGIPDGFFDMPFDTFWFNPEPDWASHDPAVDDNPSLDRDDTDGAGPENINLNLPEDGLKYRVGVHYWNDHGFGASYATVRVYIFSVLVFEVAGVEMMHHDMCEFATIDWPSGEVLPVTGPDGGYKCMPNYENPLFGGL